MIAQMMAIPSMSAMASSMVARILSPASGCLAMLSTARLAILLMPNAVASTMKLALTAAAMIDNCIIKGVVVC